MEAIHFLIALALLASSWVATVRILRRSLVVPDDPLPRSGRAENRVRPAFPLPTGPVNNPARTRERL